MDNPFPTAHSDNIDETLLKNTDDSAISCICKPPPNGVAGRNLVVSIDGTANQFGLKNTNIVELYSRLVRDEIQLTYYNSGIGTYVADSKSWLSLKAWNQSISHEWDKAFATNFKSKVLDAYEWLSENYRPGDKIFLFGFSRGAYQVRVIAGMIEKVGLLHKGNKQQIPFAYDLYTATLSKRKRQEDSEEATETASKQQQGTLNVTMDATSHSSGVQVPSQNSEKPGFRRLFGLASGQSSNVVDAQHDLPLTSADHQTDPPDADVDQNIANGRRSRASVNTDRDKAIPDDNVEGSLDESPEALCRHFKKSLSNSEARVH